MTENCVNAVQYAYLQTEKDRAVLLCWTDSQPELQVGYGHIQPNSGACQTTRYNGCIQPSILSLEDMDKPEGSLLPEACIRCRIMTNALTVVQTLDLR